MCLNSEHLPSPEEPPRLATYARFLREAEDRQDALEKLLANPPDLLLVTRREGGRHVGQGLGRGLGR